MVPRSSPHPQPIAAGRQRSKSFPEWSSSNVGSIDEEGQISEVSCMRYHQYLEKRKRNNEAAKRSREKRRLNDLLMESKLQQLSHENNLLKTKLVAMKSNPVSASNSFDEPISPTISYLGSGAPFGFPCLETSSYHEHPFQHLAYTGLSPDFAHPFMFFSPYNQIQTPISDSVDESIHDCYQFGTTKSLLLPKVSFTDRVPGSFQDPLFLNTKQYLRVKLLEKRSKSFSCLFQNVQTHFNTKEDQRSIEKLESKFGSVETAEMFQEYNSKTTAKRCTGSKPMKVQQSKRAPLENKFKKICHLEGENTKLKQVMIQLSQEVALLQNLLI